MIISIKYRKNNYIDSHNYPTELVEFTGTGVEFMVGNEYHFHPYSEVSKIVKSDADYWKAISALFYSDKHNH